MTTKDTAARNRAAFTVQAGRYADSVIAQTPDDRAVRVRERLATTIVGDRARFAPAGADGRLRVMHTTAWIIAAVPEAKRA